MNIALVDDELKERERLSAILLEKSDRISAIRQYENGEALLFDIRNGISFDVIFLDIFMEGKSGIEISRILHETGCRSALVFVTTSNAFAAESYEIEADGYLLKPVSANGIDKLFEKLRNKYEKTAEVLTLPEGKQLLIKDFLYSEYNNHRITFHMIQSADFTIYMKEVDLEALITNTKMLFPVNRGVIINFQAVVGEEKSVFILKGGVRVPISRRKDRECREAYAAFLFDKLRKG